MRTNLTRRLALLGVVIATLATTACGLFEDPTSLRLLQPGATVFIDGWDQKGAEGDRARVELKLGDMWVVPKNAEYTATKRGEFTVEIRLDPKRGFVVVNMNGVQTGRDHDNCLAEDELYAFPVDDALATAMKANMEPDKGPKDDSNDDCLLATDTEALGNTVRSQYVLVA